MMFKENKDLTSDTLIWNLFYLYEAGPKSEKNIKIIATIIWKLDLHNQSEDPDEHTYKDIDQTSLDSKIINLLYLVYLKSDSLT